MTDGVDTEEVFLRVEKRRLGAVEDVDDEVEDVEGGPTDEVGDGHADQHLVAPPPSLLRLPAPLLRPRYVGTLLQTHNDLTVHVADDETGHRILHHHSPSRISNLPGFRKGFDTESDLMERTWAVYQSHDVSIDGDR